MMLYKGSGCIVVLVVSMVDKCEGKFPIYQLEYLVAVTG